LFPILLIQFANYDELFEPTSKSGYYRQYPGINKIVSVSKQMVKYLLVAFIFSFTVIRLCLKTNALEFTGVAMIGLPSEHLFWTLACLGGTSLFLVDWARSVVFPLKIFDFLLVTEAWTRTSFDVLLNG
jgi:hypothetical protein